MYIELVAQSVTLCTNYMSYRHNMYYSGYFFMIGNEQQEILVLFNCGFSSVSAAKYKTLLMCRSG